MPVAKDRVKEHLTAEKVKGYLVIAFLMTILVLGVMSP